MTIDDEYAANRDKRPLYEVGAQLKVTLAGAYEGQIGAVQRVRAWQSIAGIVKTYEYTLQFPNLAIIPFFEESLIPIDPPAPTDSRAS
ncbi:MAG TPA: hypothetical protein VJO13_09050 [Ktedonobacterales bacterium]|nr:hypothetical protein [Ktedonobacterales bacterium]